MNRVGTRLYRGGDDRVSIEVSGPPVPVLQPDDPVGEARVGRVIDIDVEAATADEARADIERMCERLLANPLIESYEIEVAE